MFNKKYYLVNFSDDFVLTNGTLKHCKNVVDSSAGGEWFIVKKKKLTYPMLMQISKWPKISDTAENAGK